MNSSPLHLAGSIVLRGGALVAGSWAYDRLWTWFFYDRTGDEMVGADIGEGLVAFGLIALVSALWAAWDGRRRGFGETATMWVTAAVLTAVAAAVVGLAASHAVDLGTALGDLAAVSPFIIGVVAVPALAGGGLTAVLRSGHRRA